MRFKWSANKLGGVDKRSRYSSVTCSILQHSILSNLGAGPKRPNASRAASPPSPTSPLRPTSPSQLAMAAKAAMKLGLDLLNTEKPRSSVSSLLEILTSESYDEDDFAMIPELIESINVQSTGPAEASRAIRKKVSFVEVQERGVDELTRYSAPHAS